ncbi:MAG: Cro/CI family transcriptional regulator [Candidatus Methylomirabilota bacterium]
MTPEQVVKHFDNSTAFAAYNLGCSEAAVKKWIERKGVPHRIQLLVESMTAGKLKANGKGKK